MKIKTKDKIVQQVLKKMDERSLIGQKKYGATMMQEIEGQEKDLNRFLIDVQEELMDALLYIEAAKRCLQDEIEEVLVPTEEVIEIRRNKKVTAERRFMPGYVFVKMEMSDKGYHLINSINRVTGFFGPQGKPMPMRDAEVNLILNLPQHLASALVFLEGPRNR